jgi:5-methyltetrahydropteroyltriglutamate--homocysteine methyltransferase
VTKEVGIMLTATKDIRLPTALIGSLPRPSWFRKSLQGRPFKVAMSDALYREQYLDAVACHIKDQEQAGLDIVTDGDSRFDLDVGGRSWFFYPIERLGGVEGFRDSSHWMDYADLRPGHILHELQEAYHAPAAVDRLTRGPLHFAPIWQVAQRMTTKPVKFGTISAACLPMMLWDEHYHSDRELTMDVAAIMNQELKEVAAAGCQVIQIEEPPQHFASCKSPPATGEELEFLTEAVNRELQGLRAQTEVWAHTCWGNPNQQSFFWDKPSYEPALPYLLQLDADVITFECASSDGRDLRLFAKYETDKKIAIGVVTHTVTTVESPERVAGLIRKALEYIPAERLIITSDCGFGREGMSRRIARYKAVAMVQGTNIVRRELGLPEAYVATADARYAFRTPSPERAVPA